MQTAQRRLEPSVIQRLIDEPYRFEFVQAVRILLLLLRQSGVGGDDAFAHVLRFENSLSLSFPASQIESVHAPRTDTMLRLALERGELPRIGITPAFIGFLGVGGVLPLHYSESIAAALHRDKGGAGRAFLDTFSNRLVGLFYQAGEKYRLEQRRDEQGRDALLPMLLALGGVAEDGFAGARGVSADVAGYYAALLRTRPISAHTVARVLSDYFAVPIALEQFVGCWDAIPRAALSKLGGPIARLGYGATLGVRQWRRDLRVRLRIGPLDEADFERFLPRGPGAAGLEKMLALFGVPCIQYEALLLLRPPCVKPLVLSTQTRGAAKRLGWDAFLTASPGKPVRAQVRYLLHPS
ncbi:type VI secretion system baseplate subunit TssG [Janthinobacterium fluminis]|uniref:Type VI secretion system baseplate subunit TssG n=1 Tax=Janthinobacterium fluminis TaxID=2987524 RepID=A0ABT5JWG0_9BURK|nr:type VI secretion system baseplate subunit TssG [Janthinobacterium fluminis]MDC8757073.1 type VI secretion system baseplate subunit TssG [Janthinobacterium fluminis]